MSKHIEQSKFIENKNTKCIVEQFSRYISLSTTPGVKFKVEEVDLVRLASHRPGIIFRAQPGSGKTHVIKSFESAYRNIAGNDVHVRSIKWSDSMREVIGKGKPSGPLSPQKRKKASEYFFSKFKYSLNELVTKQRRGFRTHPRTVFTIAELPDGVVEDVDIKKYLQQEYLLVDIVADPLYQRIASKKRAAAWNLPPGAMLSDPPEELDELRKSAPPEILALSTRRSDKAHAQDFFEGEMDWDHLKGVPVCGKDRRSHNDRYWLSRRAVAAIHDQEKFGDMPNHVIAFNPPRFKNNVA